MNFNSFPMFFILVLNIIYFLNTAFLIGNSSLKVNLSDYFFKKGIKYAKKFEDKELDKYKLKAISYLTKAYKLGNKKALFELKILISRDYDTDGLVFTLSKAVQQFPKKSRYWFELGCAIEVNCINNSLAINCYKNAVSLKHYIALISLGRIYLSQGQIVKGLSYLNKAIKITNNQETIDCILEILNKYNELRPNNYYNYTFVSAAQKCCLIHYPDNQEAFHEALKGELSYLKSYVCLGNI